MSSATTNLGLVKMASGETIGQWSDANNGSGQNLDKIDTAIGTLNSQLGGTKIFAISKTVTVPAGDATTPGQLTVDFSSDIGNASIWLAFASLGSSVLPYVSNAGAVKTWIRTVGGSPTQQITIYNTDSAWSNYTAYFVLICK